MDEKLRVAFRKCLSITGAFEGASYQGVAGNFDGAGISAFVLQWNLLKNTLQPLLLKMNEKSPGMFKQILTTDTDLVVRTMESGSRKLEQDFVNRITRGKPYEEPPGSSRFHFEGGILVREEWKSKFADLGLVFSDIQENAAEGYFEAAVASCKTFGLRTERALAFMFDQCTQRGGRSMDDELENYKVIRNNPYFENKPETFWLKYIVDNDTPDVPQQWRVDVETRRMAIITGAGRVHGKQYDLFKNFNLTDEVVL